MREGEFNPNSWDAQFSALRTMLTTQKEQLDRIEDHTSKTNGRVTKLESDRARLIGYLLGASGVATLAVNVAFHLWK